MHFPGDLVNCLVPPGEFLGDFQKNVSKQLWFDNFEGLDAG
jgi:hypothetical protein